MDKEIKDVIREVAFEIIKEEELPAPDKILFKENLFGTKKSGTLARYKSTDTYKITINLIKPRFVEDENGKYHDRIGNRYRKAVGEERSMHKVINTVAHEIAHLKFWNHGPSHMSYTNHLNNVIKEKLEGRGVGTT